VGPALQHVIFRENIYSLNQAGGNESIVVEGSFAASSAAPAVTCQGVVIEDEMDAQQSQSPHHIRMTTASKAQYQKSATKWTFDFSDTLLLPQIDEVTCVYCRFIVNPMNRRSSQPRTA